MNIIDRLLLIFIIIMLVFNLVVVVTLILGCNQKITSLIRSQNEQLTSINDTLKEWDYASQQTEDPETNQ